MVEATSYKSLIKTKRSHLQLTEHLKFIDNNLKKQVLHLLNANQVKNAIKKK